MLASPSSSVWSMASRAELVNVRQAGGDGLDVVHALGDVRRELRQGARGGSHAHGPGGIATEGRHALGDLVDPLLDLFGNLIEELVKLPEIRAFDVPVRLLDLAQEVERIRQVLVEQRVDMPATLKTGCRRWWRTSELLPSSRPFVASAGVGMVAGLLMTQDADVLSAAGYRPRVTSMIPRSVSVDIEAFVVDALERLPEPFDVGSGASRSSSRTSRRRPAGFGRGARPLRPVPGHPTYAAIRRCGRRREQDHDLPRPVGPSQSLARGAGRARRRHRLPRDRTPLRDQRCAVARAQRGGWPSAVTAGP